MIRSSAARILDRVDKLRLTPSSWSARCPAHDDRGTNLMIDKADDGQYLVYCKAGCTTRAILTAVRLTLADFVPRGERGELVEPNASARLLDPCHDPNAPDLPAPWRPFPLELLPEPARSFTVEAAEAIQCDPAQVALPLLAALASAVGSRRVVRLKESWREPAVVWAAVVSESGNQKSPAAAIVLELVERQQQRAMVENREAERRYESEKLKYAVELADWKRSQAKRHSGDEPPAPPERPRACRLLVSDTTVEALAIALSENPAGVLLARDELAGWLGSFNQYKGGQGGDAGLWLSMHRAGPLLVDRKTGESRTVYTERAAVSITGTIQPDVLARSLGREHFENGLAARFLLAMPPARVRQWTDASMNEATRAAMERVFARLYGLDFDEREDGPVPRDVGLSTGAKRAWTEFYNRHAVELAAMTGPESAAWSKLEGYAARLALVFRLVRLAAWPRGGRPIEERSLIEIDECDVLAGAGLADWFGNEARRVYAAVGLSRSGREELRLVELIRAAGGKMSIRELMRLAPEYRGRRAAAEAGMEKLVEEGYGVWTIRGPMPWGGRPTLEFQMTLGCDETPLARNYAKRLAEKRVTARIACDET